MKAEEIVAAVGDAHGREAAVLVLREMARQAREELDELFHAGWVDEWEPIGPADLRQLADQIENGAA